MSRSRPDSSGEASRGLTVHWLAFAATSVALSGLFAVLIALARVPAIGQLFPGAEFYKVALTLHVNLSQGVWFMAFAAVLWTFHQAREHPALDRGILWLAGLGALGITLSIAIGTPQPLMSNYLPVIDSPTFLSGLLVFGLAVIAAACLALPRLPFGTLRSHGEVRAFGLWLGAAGFVICGLILAIAAARIPPEHEGHAYFELLFWGAGHAWQFVLVILMMVCWLELAGARTLRAAPRQLATAFAVAAVPLLFALGQALALPPDSDAYLNGYTRLMQWASWPAPALLLGFLLLPHRGQTRPLPGFTLSIGLLSAGIVLGILIDGQTTLVTAHYHGTIGSVTLAFMAMALAMLPRLGAVPPDRRWIRMQLGCYGYGILLMMLGLAGAGLMGAPRKTPGELGLFWNVETVSRICLGIGGLLATVGILMFAYLILSRLWPHAQSRRLQDPLTR
ncbi:MAG: cbb3-type cytochrome c oxidase subunit I [Rhodocyclaceae bacterium]|nr:cbb3-type cytochrome c oxidase subunit I [Rhodocyclaceae bacterium]